MLGMWKTKSIKKIKVLNLSIELPTKVALNNLCTYKKYCRNKIRQLIKKIAIYETCDGSRFDQLYEAEDYENRLKNKAINSLCNHQYDEWEDYMFNQNVID